MAFALIDDLTGDQHPMESARRLTLHLDDREIAGWDVASADPRELLAQLGEHLSGIAAPLTPDRGPLPGIESLRQALAGVRVVANPDTGRVSLVPREVEESAEVLDPDKPEPTVTHTTTVTRLPVPEPRPTATQRVAEALGGQATDSVVRAWAANYNVPCSTTGKLNGWARAAYLRVRGGEPDQQLWDDYKLAVDYRATKRPQPSSSVAPSDAETPPSSDPGPPSGRAAAGPPAPDRAARGPADSPAPAPTGEGGAGAGEVQADGDRVRPEQLDMAEELAADGRTPREIVEATGVPLEKARELFASAKGPKR